MALWPLFSTKLYGGWGLWLKDAGRGAQKIAKIAKIAGIAKIENPKESQGIADIAVIAEIARHRA